MEVSWQGRRHKFESGGYNLRAKRAKKNFFVPPHFLYSGGYSGGVHLETKHEKSNHCFSERLAYTVYVV